MKRNNFLSLCVCVLCPIVVVMRLDVSAERMRPRAAYSPNLISTARFIPTYRRRSEISSIRSRFRPSAITWPARHLKPKLQKQLQFAAQRGETSSAAQSNAPVQQLAPVTATVGVNVLGVGIGFHGYTVPDAPT